jgi:hypothetical protein
MVAFSACLIASCTGNGATVCRQLNVFAERIVDAAGDPAGTAWRALQVAHKKTLRRAA